MKSWSNNRDCFGNSGDATKDHIYPKARKGTNKSINIQKLAQASNEAKGNKLKGIINNIEFKVIKQTTKDKEIYGKMQIKINNEFVWVENE